MKLDTPVPFAGLSWFQEKLGLRVHEQQNLARHRGVFLMAKQRFAEEFFRYFWEIKETRILLEYESRGPISLELNSNSLHVQGDSEDLEIPFHYLLQNRSPPSPVPLFLCAYVPLHLRASLSETRYLEGSRMKASRQPALQKR
jgi:hypothetical protein